MHVAIIGNGIAGITAARTIRKLQPDWRITVISSETDHFYSRTALMYIYMGHMTYDDTKPYEDWFWPKNRIELIRGHVDDVDFEERRLFMEDGASLEYDKLILALGSVNHLAGWKGQDLPGVQGLITYPDVELLEENTRNVRRGVVVGGGLVGIEFAEMLRSRGIEVTFLVREKAYMEKVFPKAESDLIHGQIRAHGVDLRLDTQLEEIQAGDDGRVASVRTGAGDTITCGVVGLTAGVRPNIALAKAWGIETAKGILVDRNFRTNQPDVFAAGDCAEMRDPPPRTKAVEPIWYRAREQGEAAGLNVAGRPTEYTPSLFYNSAKFFDLEYQTYGHVEAQLPANQDTDLRTNGRDRLLRINFEKGSRAVVGFNALGIRLRHQVCARWIEARSSIDHVQEHLREAIFDPEFSSGKLLKK